MDDKQAYELIGERAAEIVKHKMIQAAITVMMADGYTKDEIISWVYKVAIGTLYGRAAK